MNLSEIAAEHLAAVEKSRRQIARSLEAKEPFRIQACDLCEEVLLPILKRAARELAALSIECGVSNGGSQEGEAPLAVLRIVSPSTCSRVLESIGIFRHEYDDWLVWETLAASARYPQAGGFANSVRFRFRDVDAALIERLTTEFIRSAFHNARS